MSNCLKMFSETIHKVKARGNLHNQLKILATEVAIDTECSQKFPLSTKEKSLK